MLGLAFISPAFATDPQSGAEELSPPTTRRLQRVPFRFTVKEKHAPQGADNRVAPREKKHEAQGADNRVAPREKKHETQGADNRVASREKSRKRVAFRFTISQRGVKGVKKPHQLKTVVAKHDIRKPHQLKTEERRSKKPHQLKTELRGTKKKPHDDDVMELHTRRAVRAVDKFPLRPMKDRGNRLRIGGTIVLD